MVRKKTYRFESGNVGHPIIWRDLIDRLATRLAFKEKIGFLRHTLECFVAGAEVDDCGPVVAMVLFGD